MFLFLRLLLAHFLGDTLFQPDEVYAIKTKGFRGTVIHTAIILLTLILFSLPYLKYGGTWLVLAAAGITHLVQDELKIRRFSGKKLNFIVFMLDQIFHIVFLSLIFLFKFAYTAPARQEGIYKLYNNNSLVIIAIGYVVIVFLAAYLWESFKSAYFKNPGIFNPYFIKYGMFERFIIVSAVLFSFLPFLAIPVIPHILNKRLRFSSEFIYNLFFSVSAGLFLKQFLPIF